jgi:hypothetical protein
MATRPDVGRAHDQNHAPPRANHPRALGEYLPHVTEVAVDDPGSLPVAPQSTNERVHSRLSTLGGERLARRRLHERGALAADVAAAERTVCVRADAQYIGHPRDREPVSTGVVQGRAVRRREEGKVHHAVGQPQGSGVAPLHPHRWPLDARLLQAPTIVHHHRPHPPQAGEEPHVHVRRAWPRPVVVTRVDQVPNVGHRRPRHDQRREHHPQEVRHIGPCLHTLKRSPQLSKLRRDMGMEPSVQARQVRAPPVIDSILEEKLLDLTHGGLKPVEVNRRHLRLSDQVRERVQLDSADPPPEQTALDKRGATTGHRVEDQFPGCAIGADGPVCKRRWASGREGMERMGRVKIPGGAEVEVDRCGHLARPTHVVVVALHRPGRAWRSDATEPITRARPPRRVQGRLSANA